MAQLVARVVWDHEAAGSKPVTSTKKKPYFFRERNLWKFFVVLRVSFLLWGKLRCFHLVKGIRSERVSWWLGLLDLHLFRIATEQGQKVAIKVSAQEPSLRTPRETGLAPCFLVANGALLTWCAWKWKSLKPLLQVARGQILTLLFYSSSAKSSW